MGLTLVSAPAAYPVSLETVKQHVRVTGTARDDILQVYLAAATEAVERFIGRSLIDQTWDLFLDAFPDDDGAIELLRPPLIEVVGVFYTDDAGVEQEMDAGDYVVDASKAVPTISLAGASWPTARDAEGAVRVRYRAGYLDQTVSPAEASVPFAVQAGILLFVGNLYANRESIAVGDQAVELPGLSESLLRPYRVNLGMA